MTGQPAGQNARQRTVCRLCGSRRLQPVLSLTPTPPANGFVPAALRGSPQPAYPLDLHFCQDCTHVQLLTVVSPDELFSNYVYVSGTSPVFVAHFADYARSLDGRLGLGPGALVLDIGSNDGTLLKQFQARGAAVLGVDPARAIAQAATAAGVETWNDFFSPALAERIRAEKGPARLVTANNVFAHIDDLTGILHGVRAVLDDGGLFSFEVSYLLDVVRDTLFDTIYHEHLDYHTVAPLVGFFAANGMELVAVERIASHGGSIRGIAQKAGGPHALEASVAQLVALERQAGLDRPETLIGFGRQIDALGQQLRTLLARLKAEGKTIAGYGAPAKATTLMYHFGLDGTVIDFIVDDSPLKQGLFSPGLHIPVVGSAHLERHPVDYLIILAWNFAGPIMQRMAPFADRGGHFIVPLPNVTVY